MDNNFNQLRGSAAKAVGCPTTAAASRKFRSQNPGLFNVSGLSIHPYGQRQSPVSKAGNKVDYALFQDIPQIEATIDHVNKVYGSGKRYPDLQHRVRLHHQPAEHAPHAALRLAGDRGLLHQLGASTSRWKQNRVASYMQFLLADPPPTAGPYAGFASGLEFPNGSHKPGYDAYRLPVFMPKTNLKRRPVAEVWGEARASRFMQTRHPSEPDGADPVPARRARGVDDPAEDHHGRVLRRPCEDPAGGNLRLAYTYPQTDAFLPVGVAGSDGGQPDNQDHLSNDPRESSDHWIGRPMIGDTEGRCRPARPQSSPVCRRYAVASSC